jgi:hypothetical protein
MPPIPLESVDPAMRRTDYYESVATMPGAVLAAQARRAVALASRLPQGAGMPPLGSRSVLDMAIQAQAPQPSTRPPAPGPAASPVRAQASARPDPAGSGPQAGAARSSRPEKAQTLMDVLLQSRAARDDAS